MRAARQRQSARPRDPMRARRPGRALAGVLLAAGIAAPAAADPCAPWPGEPTPLPTRSDPDPLRAEWAGLRAHEFAAAARRLEEEGDPLLAHALWRRVLCLDPASDAARAGLRRTPLVRVHRPPVRDAEPETPPPDDPWLALGSPIDVPLDLARERAAEERAAEILELRRAVARTRAQVQGARFDVALESATALRPRIAEAPPGAAQQGLLAELEVLAATAELALGRDGAARASLRRALDAEPDLALDPRTTSPKVLRALERARGEDAP